MHLRGLIEPIPGTHRYTVTDDGLALAIFLTSVHRRLIGPGLSDLVDDRHPGPLRRDLDRLSTAISKRASELDLAA